MQENGGSIPMLFLTLYRHLCYKASKKRMEKLIFLETNNLFPQYYQNLSCDKMVSDE